MERKSKLLAFDEDRIALKPELELKDCEHPSVLYVEKDCAWTCMKCNEKLAICGGEEFRLFCELTGKDPKNLIL